MGRDESKCVSYLPDSHMINLILSSILVLVLLEVELESWMRLWSAMS